MSSKGFEVSIGSLNCSLLHFTQTRFFLTQHFGLAIFPVQLGRINMQGQRPTHGIEKTGVLGGFFCCFGFFLIRATYPVGIELSILTIVNNIIAYWHLKSLPQDINDYCPSIKGQQLWLVPCHGIDFHYPNSTWASLLSPVSSQCSADINS